MDITIFLFFSILVVILFILAWLSGGGLGVGLGWLAGGLALLTGLQIGLGEPITALSSGEIIELDLGLNTSRVSIFYILFGILSFVECSCDWLFRR